jgi:hypothetical protein
MTGVANCQWPQRERATVTRRACAKEARLVRSAGHAPGSASGRPEENSRMSTRAQSLFSARGIMLVQPGGVEWAGQP